MNVTIIIAIITFLISYRCFQDQGLMHRLKHYPYAENKNKEYYRLLSSGFVHGDWTHLIINLYVFYEFGSVVEKIFTMIHGELMGRIWFVILYFGALIISDLPTLIKHKNNPSFASIGASGAVSGILFAYILFEPWSMLALFFIIPIPAIVFAVLYLIYSSWAEKNQGGRIDHSAHYYGAIAGLIVTIASFPDVINLFLSKLSELPF
jgi:membrane associated rhomboid family serine protease